MKVRERLELISGIMFMVSSQSQQEMVDSRSVLQVLR